MTVDLGASFVGELQMLVEPLVRAADADDVVGAICRAINWNPDALPLGPIRGALASATTLADALEKLATDPDAESLVAVCVDIEKLFDAMGKIDPSTLAGLPPETLGVLVGDLGIALLDGYLLSRAPTVRTVLAILGICEPKLASGLVAANGTTVRSAIARPVWDLGAFADLLANPAQYARRRFLEAGTGQALLAEALADRFGPLLVDALGKVGFDVGYGIAGAALDPSLPADVRDAATRVLFAQQWFDVGPLAGSRILVAAGLGNGPNGVALLLAAAAELDATWKLDLLESKLSVAVGPDTLTIQRGGISATTGAPKLGATFETTWRDPAGPIARFGKPDGLYVELGAIEATAKAELDQGMLAWTAGCKLADFAVSLRANDGFLAQILPKDGVRAKLDLAATWSDRSGLVINGGAALAFRIPLDLSIGGVLDIPAVDIELTLRDKFSFGARTQLHATIGPVDVIVDGLGFGLGMTPKPGGGLGAFSFDFAVLPPKGVGLSVDAGVVKGGGYLFIDPDNHRYLGAGSLAIHAGVELSLDILILITSDPHPAPGQPGFSLLALACVQFSPGIALFGGFFLTGLGVLIGIERAFDTEVMREGVKSGLLRSILFPNNPVADAPKLLGDLDRVFPAAKDRFVFGALAKISYGTGAAEIFSAELGLAVALGGPFVLAVLGSLALRWPRDADKEVLVLQLDCVGMWDSGSKLVSIDAALRDSRILTWPLTGGAAFRAGGDVGFLLSVGGYHPHFQAPPSFPQLDRLSLSISAGPARVRFETYTAITSNTFQIGAHADASVDLKVCSVEGHLAFDALVQFSPFHFEVDIDASLTIKVAGATLLGIGVSLHVSGPNPWHLAGTLHLQILCFKVDAKFDAVFGDTVPPASLPLVDPVPVLATALQQPRAWSAALPDAQATLISFATTAASSDASAPIPVHPLAQLRVQQREIPLGIELDHIGAANVTTRQQLTITTAIIGTKSVSTTAVQDVFAAAQFVEMSDDEKLARPSFEAMDAGVALAVADPTQSIPAPAALTYETWIMDNGIETQAGAFTPTMHAPLPSAAHALAGAHVPIKVTARSYVVASRDDLTHASKDPATSYTRAHQLARRLAATKPALRGKLQLVGEEEVA